MHGPGTKQRLSLESLRRVKPGDPVSASLTNRQSAAIESILSSLNGGAQSPITPSTCVVTVKNGSGDERRDGDTLQITGIFYDEEDSLKNGTLAFTAGAVSDPDEPGCVILRQTIPDGSAGPAQLLGVCMAYVNITDSTHKFAEFDDSSFTLTSSATGPVQIIHKPSGGDPTGEKSCAVLIGAGGSSCGIHHVEVLPATSGRQKGIYQFFCSDPDTPVLVYPIRTGYCPSSGSPGSSGSCSTDGYDPGGSWTSGPAGGYDAAWYSPDGVAPADPPTGSWTLIAVFDGDIAYGAWRNLECNWIAYGDGYTP